MIISNTISAFVKKGFTLEETVDINAAAGFTGIDFGFHNSEKYYNEDTDSEIFKEYFTELRKRAESKGVVFAQAHAPAPSSDRDEAISEKIFHNIRRTLRNASYLGIPIVVVHPCQHLTFCKEGVPELLYEYNMKFYNALKPYAEEYGVKIALENMWQYIKGNNIDHSTCSRPDEFIKYYDPLDKNVFTCCLDIGHTFLVREDPAAFIKKLGADRLGCLHVHDVDGINDSHTMPFYGNINWDSVCSALKDIGYRGNFTYEANSFLLPLPKELYPDGAKLMSEVAKYLVNKIKN